MEEQKVYGYARVSSNDQNESRQIQAFYDYGITKDRIFVDKQSGKDFDRTNCNAENLEWVTHKENIEYSVKNNRWYLVENDCTGSNNFNAKLNEEKVKDIRKRYSNKEPIYKIAKLYNVGWTTVSHIVKNETWKNI